MPIGTMKISKGKIRYMRDELRERGIKKTDTSDEVRISHKLDNLTVTLNFLPPLLRQAMHQHLLIYEAIHVLDGKIDVFAEHEWMALRRGNIVSFKPGETHTLRTGLEPFKPISFPGLSMNAAAVVLAYKWLPLGFVGSYNEARLILDNDWFPSGKVSFQIPIQDLNRNERRKILNVFGKNKVNPEFIPVMKFFT